jgi:predicted nucleic acid-binding protein
MSDLFFIDTNILMYAVGTEHPLKQPCLRILEKISQGEIAAATDTEVFQEVAYRYWSQKKWSIALEVLRDFQHLFSEIYPVEKQHLDLFYSLLTDEKKLSPRDVIHIAVMQSQGLKNIYTADRAFANVRGLKVHFPS